MSDGLFYLLGSLDMPGMAVLVIHTIWTFMSVIRKEYPGSRALKIFTILLTGPIATLAIGIRYGKR